MQTEAEGRRAYAQKLGRVLWAERILSEIAQQFIRLTPNTLSTSIRTALARIGEIFGVDRCYVFEFSQLGDVMSNTYEWCGPDVSSEIDSLQDLPTDAFPWWVSRIRAGQGITLMSLDDLPAEATSEREYLAMQSIQSLLVLPLLVDQHAIGFIGFDAVKAPRTWSDEKNVLDVLGEIISLVLDRRSRQLALESSRDFYRTLFDGAITANLVINASNEVIAVNSRFTEMTGFSLEEAASLYRHPEFGKQHNCSDPLTDGTRFCRYPTRDGRMLDILAAGAQIGETGNRIISFIDVTEMKRMEHDLQSSLYRIETTFLSTIDAFGRIVEVYDPYTAGHQKRIAALAERIADRMGLDTETRQCVYLAALLHDIGKIYVPAQILSKPSDLSELEFEMVKTHVSAGAEILGT
jgi:putative nucleotidyltransferase with HDIG domain/PAS domain S-box-containing protein